VPPAAYPYSWCVTSRYEDFKRIYIYYHVLLSHCQLLRHTRDDNHHLKCYLVIWHCSVWKYFYTTCCWILAKTETCRKLYSRIWYSILRASRGRSCDRREGPATGRKVLRPAGRSGDRPEGPATGRKVLRPAGRSGDRPEGPATGRKVRRPAGRSCDRPEGPAIARKVLRPAISTQVFLGFPVSISKCWDGSQDFKFPLRASHVALPS
jgi:hypothetical protein